MPLIDHTARVIEDPWIYPSADEAPIRPHVILPIDALASAGADAIVIRPLGALISPDTPTEKIAPLLAMLDLVVVEFPKFRDGRGFTIGRTLRGRLGFKGDIRAIGHVLPDQFAFLLQCGFSSIVTPPEHPPEHWSGHGSAITPDLKRPVQLLNRLISRTVYPGR